MSNERREIPSTSYASRRASFATANPPMQVATIDDYVKNI